MPNIDVRLSEEVMDYLLSGFFAASGQRLISNDRLVRMVNYSLREVHIELVRLSRNQVQRNG
ncbi:hypothetical protein ACVWZX_000434 [Deinococcus sp. UYEF24]